MKKNKVIILFYTSISLFSILLMNIVINVSPSSPMGIYLINRFDKNYKVGNYIVYDIPSKYKKYLHRDLKNLETIKQIKAIEGDRINIVDNKVFVNDQFQGKIIKEIESEITNKILSKNEILTLSDNPISLDGRYYGTINKKDIKYKAYLIFKL